MKKILQLVFICSFTLAKAQTPIYQFKFDGNNSLSIGGSSSLNFIDDDAVSALTNENDRSEVGTSAVRLFKKKGTISLANLPQGAAARTVSFWMKDNSNSSNGNGNAPFSYGNVTAGNGQNFTFIIRRDLDQMYISGGAGGFLHVINGNLPSLNKWHHYALTYDGTNVKLYIDNNLKATVAMTLNTVGTTFRVGYESDTTARTSNVVIDDLNIFSSALTQGQITTLFKSNFNQTPLQSGIPTNGLVYANHFTNGNISDSSPTGAVVDDFTTTTTSLDAQGVANNSRFFELGQIMSYQINNYPEMRVGTLSSNSYEFSISVQLKVDPAYYNSLNSGSYITFFTHGGIYMRILKGGSGAAFQAGYQYTNGTFPAPLNVSTNVDFTTNFVTVTFTNSTNGVDAKLYINNSIPPQSGNTSGVYYNSLPVSTIGYPNNAGNNFKGTIDNLFIYNRVLSGAEVATIINNTTLSSSTFNNNLKFSLYPNPANDVVSIDLETEIKSIEIYSLQGQKVLSSKEKQVNISNLSKGIYMVRVEDEIGSVSTKKLIKN